MAAQDVFEEHLGVIAALKDNYARKDDAAAAASIIGLQKEISQLCSSREEHVKEAIKELTKSVREAEIAATYPEPEGAHAARSEALASAASTARGAVQGLTAQLEALRGQQEVLKAKFKELRKKSEHIEMIVADAEPRTRHELSLYAHVSKITWQFDAPGAVAGTISDPATDNTRRFEFDSEATPAFEVTNQLWEMLQ